MNFENALGEVLNIFPIVTAILASIGLATIVIVVWSAMEPFLCYITSGQRQLMTFWLYSLIIAGGGFFGYSYSAFDGMWCGFGVTSFSLGVLTTGFYWIRQWVKWSYSEKDTL